MRAARTPRPPQTKAGLHGWNDAIAGRGFAAEYERYSGVQQHHYEEGRLKAVRSGLALFRRFDDRKPGG